MIISRAVRQIALTAFIVGLFPFNANAESKAGDTFGDWVIECHQSTPEKADTNTCVLTQTVVGKDKKLKLLKIILGQGKDDSFITALVPLGILGGDRHERFHRISVPGVHQQGLRGLVVPEAAFAGI